MTSGILKEIIAHKKMELSSMKGGENTLEALKKKIDTLAPARDFASALKKQGTNIIAEVKKASPSKGILREDFNPAKIARIYEENGASAISVLTDGKYFMGSLDDLKAVKESVGVPVLRKDFIIDPYQVYESRLYGADAVLLIVAALSENELGGMLRLGESMGMCPFVEVHSEDELDCAISSGAAVIGINNRDLNTFRVDVSTTLRLAKKIPAGRLVVSESGITTAADIRKLKDAGVDAFLVGEALLREKDIAGKFKELKGAV